MRKSVVRSVARARSSVLALAGSTLVFTLRPSSPQAAFSQWLSIIGWGRREEHRKQPFLPNAGLLNMQSLLQESPLAWLRCLWSWLHSEACSMQSSFSSPLYSQMPHLQHGLKTHLYSCSLCPLCSTIISHNKPLEFLILNVFSPENPKCIKTLWKRESEIIMWEGELGTTDISIKTKS